MHNFTQEDLIQYLYKETSPEITIAIENAMQVDFTLRNTMEQLMISQKQLDSVKLLAPRKQSVDAILQYAEKSIGELTAH